jgi:two-component system sensor histidine kinase/response regulator
MPKMDGFALAERIKQSPKLAAATIMMLTSAGQRGDVARCGDLGVAVYLIKPIRQTELLEAILTVLGSSQPVTEHSKVITRHTLRENRRKLRVLLAEDNVVNQVLAVRILEKRGHSVTVVGNGREAVEMARNSVFDVVLMDVQMPEMNGLEATGAIREEEESTGRHLPIIAMTAHAMTGDRERTLAAGMDGYISKPVKTEDLIEILENLAQAPEIPRAPVASEPHEPVPIDMTAALAQVQGDSDLLSELASLFLEELPGMLASIRNGVSKGDASLIEQAAHKLRGSVGNFSAPYAFAAAAKLEAIGREGNVPHAHAALVDLETEIARLAQALAKLKKGHAPQQPYDESPREQKRSQA